MPLPKTSTANPLERSFVLVRLRRQVLPDGYERVEATGMPESPGKDLQIEKMGFKSLGWQKSCGAGSFQYGKFPWKPER
jgi:hypothetical protein